MYARPRARQTVRTSQLASFPAPKAGWIANRNYAQPNQRQPGAEVLDNFFPSARAAILRRGSQEYVTVGDSTVEALFVYKSGAKNEFFAASETAITDITNSASPAAVAVGQTSGDWSVVQFSTSGGAFLVCVNGDDPMRLYDGALWHPIDGDATETLAYDSGSADFTVGETVTGGTSGATATIVNVAGDTASGTLILTGTSGGPFENNEALADGGGGSANANGVNVSGYNALTGPTSTDDLIHVWSHKNRIWFVEKDSLNAWHLAVDAITGTATKFPLGGIFNLGGSLLFGASWSIESGDGLGARCVFVSTEGEVAVYSGTDPTDAGDWQLRGLYRVGKPMGKKAFVRAGGDLIIATDVGFLPLSMAINRDVAALAPAAVSYAIEDAWNDAVAQRGGAAWACETWSAGRMIAVALPTVSSTSPVWFVVNTRTMAWGRFTGWDAACVAEYDGRLFFGSTSGRVVESSVTGEDEGAVYTGVYVPLFYDFRSPASLKVGKVARAVVRSAVPVNMKVTLLADFDLTLPAAPASVPVGDVSVWGTGTWGESTWGDDGASVTGQDWTSVAGAGYTLAAAMQVTSGDTVPLDVEIVRTEVTFTTADVIS